MTVDRSREWPGRRESDDPARVLVTIVNWNGGDTALDCLRSLYESDYRSFAVVVVDNNSSDGSADRIERTYPRVELVRNASNLGFTGGQNQALRLARERGHEFAFMLNGDALVSGDTLGALVAELDAHPRAAAAAPVILDAEHYPAIQFCGGTIDWGTFTFRNWETTAAALAAQTADPANFYLWGTALMLRTSSLAAIGMLDDAFFAYYEDVDLCARAARHGYECRLVASSRVRHWGRQDWSLRSAHHVYYNVRNRALFWTKHLARPHRARFWRECFAAALITAGDFRDAGDDSRMHAALLGVWDAWNRRGGAFDPARRVPPLVVSVTTAHPYFLANILRSKGVQSVRRRLRRRMGST